MKYNIYTFIGIIAWLVMFKLATLIQGITEHNILMGVCALLMTKLVLDEINKKDN